MLTEAEAREIVKNAMSKSYIEARLWEAKGFLAGLSHERARAERLVEVVKDLLPFVRGVLYDDAPTKYRKAQEALAKATALQEKGEKS